MRRFWLRGKLKFNCNSSGTFLSYYIGHRSVTTLMDSVAIPTVAGRGRVPELAAYYARILEGAGFAAEDIVITPIGETATLAEKYRGAEMVLNGDGGGGALSDDGQARYYLMQAAEKTYVDFQLEFTNPGGHSSRPSKPNAITQLANALARLGAYDFPPQLSELTRASLTGMASQVDPNWALTR